MKTVFSCAVTKIGEDAEELREMGTMVLFGEEAIANYQDLGIDCICYLHDFPKVPYFNVKAGQILFIGDKTYPVIAVGMAANYNLKHYGHVSMKFVASEDIDKPMPGDIFVLRGDKVEVKVGTRIRFKTR